MRVILHTDDLAITRASSEGMIAAWRAGALDSFSLIANGDAAEWVRETLAAEPERPARLAVHLNLTEGPASAGACPPLTDAEGRFCKNFGGLLLEACHPLPSRRRALVAAVEAECRAQIRAVRAMCGERPLPALDGHNHVHMLPGVLGAVARAAAAEGLSEMRISREPFHLAQSGDLLRVTWWINVVKHVLLRILALGSGARLRAAGLRAPDRLIGVLYTGEMTAARALAGVAAARRSGAERIEVVFHVGRAASTETGRWRGSTFYTEFHLSEARDREREELLALAPRLCAERGLT